MRTYYINLENGSGDGLSPDHPRGSYLDLNIQPGDHILFQCGSRIYGCLDTVCGAPGQPITYGSYGEGPKPVFSGAVDVSEREAWVPAGKNIWKCVKEVPAETCNIIFNDGAFCGALRWDPLELTQPGDWFDSRIGLSAQKGESYPDQDRQILLLYCEQHPADCYEKIECTTSQYRELCNLFSNVTVENLTFEKNGTHGLTSKYPGAGENITVRGCDIRLIGGAVWHRGRQIRFGNGVEFWDKSRNISVVNNHFCDIYDSGVTHQGGRNCQVTENAHFDNNVFEKCGMGAYEARDLVPRNLTFNNNLCADAGEGFSKNGVTMPRQSEIWPQPMGHHVFIWRIEQATQGGSLQIHGNTFRNAPYGAAIYSIAAAEAEAQFDIDHNTYHTENPSLLNHIGGKDYTTFADYRRETGWDTNGRWEERTPDSSYHF